MTKATVSKPVTKTAATAPQAATSQAAKNRPLRTFAQGDVLASVWARDHMFEGQPRRYYSVSFERKYKDKDGENRYTRNFNPDDLGALMSLCQQAAEYLLELQNMVQATAED